MKYILFTLLFLSINIGYSQTKPTNSTQLEQTNPYLDKPLAVNQFLYFDSDLIRFNFEKLSPYFHKKNIDLLEKPKLLWGIEYGAQYKALFFGVNMNFSSLSGSVTDTIDTKTNYTRFGVSIGYYILNSKHLQLVPRMSFYVNNLSLRNYNSKDEIPLDDYIYNPDFKLNFRQFTGLFGLDINIKIHKISTKPGQPFLIGIKTGYNVDLGGTKITSAENTLKSDADISSLPLSFGLHFTMLL